MEVPGGAILQYTGPVLGPELLSIDSCDEFGLIVQIVDKGCDPADRRAFPLGRHRVP